MRIADWWWRFKYHLQPRVQYEVITWVPSADDPEGGNCYDEFLVKVPMEVGIDPENPWVEDVLRVATVRDNPRDLPRQQAKLPVFALGEILVVDRGGREIGGWGRKPSKWMVESERFWRVSRVVARAKEIARGIS